MVAVSCQVLTDFLRIMLEIINCILATGLPRNPELVYALLHKQEMFAALRRQPRLMELVDNIQVGIKDGVSANRSEGIVTELL
jgi:hypothetical protein